LLPLTRIRIFCFTLLTLTFTRQLPAAEVTVSPRAIPDAEVVDQDGRQLHFYSDLVKGKTVAIQFIFTSCTAICPPMAVTFRSVQRKLNELTPDRGGIELISVTVDPEHDTPSALHAFSEKFGRLPGWTLVTGDRPEIDRILRHFGVLLQSRTAHTSMLTLGNDRTGIWTRSYGLAPSDSIVKMIYEISQKSGK
jgi:cytochrome oxidase Cu insertion factor (SCO1/SenC/PrrC family)